METLEQLRGLVDGFNDDPFVGDSAQRLALDDPAGQPIADQPWPVGIGWTTATDLELHQLAGTHPRDRGDGNDRRGADDPDQSDSLQPVQRKRPDDLAVAISVCDGGRATPELPFRPDNTQGRLDLVPETGDPGAEELSESGLAGQETQRDRGQRVLRRPAGGDPVPDVVIGQQRQRLTHAFVIGQEPGELGSGKPGGGGVVA